MKDLVKVLVVDDDSLVRELVSEILAEEGYSASGVSNGIEAIKKLKAGEKFDLIISDIEMPVMTGIKLAREMRSISSVPLILMSGNATPHLKEIAALADYFLLKPFEFNDLLSAVKKALGG